MHMPLLRLRPAAGLVPAVLLLALATAACGDSEPASDFPTEQETSPTATATDDPAPTPSTDPTGGRTGDPMSTPAPDHTLPGGSALPADGDVQLVLRVTDSGGTVTEHDLSCTAEGTAGGDHPDPAVACADLYRALANGDPLQPVGPDVICTQEYGGPETAEVAGTIGGAEVSTSFSLTDGCEIARWQAMGAVLQPFGGGR